MFGLSAVTKVAIAWFGSSSAVAGLMWVFSTSSSRNYDFFLLQSVPSKQTSQLPNNLNQLATVSDDVITSKNYRCLFTTNQNTPMVDQTCVLLKFTPKLKNIKHINNDTYKDNTKPIKNRSELMDNQFYVLRTGSNQFLKMSSTNHGITLIDNKTETTKFKLASFQTLMKINSKNLISNLILASSESVPKTLTTVKDLDTSKFVCVIEGYNAGKIACNVFNVRLDGNKSTTLDVHADASKQVTNANSISPNSIIAFQLNQYLSLQKLRKSYSISWYKVETNDRHTLLASFKIKKLLLGNLINRPFSTFHYY